VFVDPSQPETDPLRARAAQIVQRGAERGDSDGTIAQRLRQELDLDPVEVNNVMRDLAIQAIVRQPLYFAEGSLWFALRIFNGIEIGLRDHESERKDVEWNERTQSLLSHVRSEDDARFANGLLKLWQPALWAPLPVILFAVGIAVSLLPGWRPGLVLGASVTLLIVASAALNGPQERYRYPVDPAIAVLVTSGVVATVQLLWRAISGRTRSTLTPRPPHPTYHEAPYPHGPVRGRGGDEVLLPSPAAGRGAGGRGDTGAPW
jgi:hypothetical protein